MTYRAVCSTCFRPTVVCYCAHVETLETATRVLFLQHPRERDVPIGTARIARLCLPRSEIRVGVDFANDPVVRAALADTERPPVLLFPGPDARDLRTDPPAGPVTLVVVDGTWWQAAKLLKTNPALRALPQYRLAPAQPSRYRIRREPAEECVSTIEALAEVLGVLEGDAPRMARLLKPFEAMVERQLAHARSPSARSRHLPRVRTVKARPVPLVFRERPHDVVLACGETNAWPYGTPGAAAPEIVHWTAIRPSTGERFEAVVRPRNALAPSVPSYTELPREQIEAGEPFAEFRARWEAFATPTDVLGYWGPHASLTLEAEGLGFATRLDMREAAIRHLGRKPGSIQACAEELGGVVPAPWARGRAGARLAALAVIAARFTADAAPRET